MARIPLIGGAYQAKSIIANAQRCVNLYPEANPQSDQPPSPATHYPTPGLVKIGEIVPPDVPNVWVVSQSCALLQFNETDTGNVAPTINIVGNNTMMTGPLGDNYSQTMALDFDSHGQKFVIQNSCTDIGTNAALTSVLVFGRAANGNVAPTYMISGDQTGLIDYFVGLGFSSGLSLCLDDDNNIYVAQFFTMLKFPAGSSGNVASTEFAPDGNRSRSIISMTFDSLRQWIWISLDDTTGDTIQAFDLQGNRRRSIQISTYTPYQIAIAEDGSILVAVQKGSAGGIMVFSSGASGAATPSRFIVGAATQLVHPQGVGIDNTTGRIYVSETGSPERILSFESGADGNATPLTNIQGNLTELGLLPSGDPTSPIRIVMHA